jgi:hypothetical protein
LILRHKTMDNFQKHNSFNTDKPSSESYRNYLWTSRGFMVVMPSGPCYSTFSGKSHWRWRHHSITHGVTKKLQRLQIPLPLKPGSIILFCLEKNRSPSYTFPNNHFGKPNVTPILRALIGGWTQKYPDWVHNETNNTDTQSEATQRVMAAKLTRYTHKISTQLHLVAESCTICSSPSRRPVRKLVDTPSHPRILRLIYSLNALHTFPHYFATLC